MSVFMKGLCWLLVILGMLVSLWGCSGNAEATSATPSGEFSFAFVENITIQDYDEYLSYLVDATLPDDFLYYENAKHFGTFQSYMGNRSYKTNELVSWYAYDLIDQSGEKLFLKITLADELLIEKKIITDINKADMRFLPNPAETKSVKAVVYGVSYHYKNGELLSITWQDEKRDYYLSGSYLFEHPLDNTVVGQLLNIEGKTEAELFALLDGSVFDNESLKNTGYLKTILLLSGGVMVVSITVTAIILLRRKKLRATEE